MEENFSALKNCELFLGIGEESLAAMLKCLDARVREFGKDETIFREGQEVKCIGIVLSGEVQVMQDDYFGYRSIWARIGTSGLFGEAFACAGTDFLPVNVTAVEDSKIMFINCSRITITCSNACGFHQQVIFNLLHALAAKNVMLRQKMEITSKRTTREKLLAYLALQAKLHHSNTFTIPYDRQELANYLQVDRSAMSAEIGRLRKEGLIQCSRSRFTII